MRSLSLTARVGAVVLTLIAIDIAIASLALEQMEIVNQVMTKVTGTLMPRMDRGTALRDISRRLAIAERVLFTDASSERQSATIKDIKDLSDSFTKTLDAAQMGATDRRLESIGKAKDYFTQWSKINSQVQAYVLSNKQGDALALTNEKSRQLMYSLQLELSQLVNVDKNTMDRETELIALEYAKAKDTLALFIVLTLVFGVGVSFIVLRSLSRAITQIVDRLGTSTSCVSSASDRVAKSSQILSASSQEQAGSVERTSTAVNDMAGMIKRNVENAKKTNEISIISDQAARKGKEIVLQMADSVAQINASNDNFVQQINDHNAQLTQIASIIGDIGDKTHVINDIAVQTKLLSLNASVEAARAGEHGKGFAVVAEEVRNLTQITGHAAKDISMMIEESLKKVTHFMESTHLRVKVLMEEGDRCTKLGTQVTRECSQALDEIVSNVSFVKQMSSEISLASREQESEIDIILDSVSKLNQRAQENSTVSREVALVGEELSVQAQDLRGSVSALLEAIRGGSPLQVAPVISAKKFSSVMMPSFKKMPPPPMAPVIPIRPAFEADQDQISVVDYKTGTED